MKQMRLFESNDVWTLSYEISRARPNISVVCIVHRSFAIMNDALNYQYDLLCEPNKYRNTQLKLERYFEYNN